MKSASDRTLRSVGDGADVADSGLKFQVFNLRFEIAIPTVALLFELDLRAKRKIGPP